MFEPRKTIGRSPQWNADAGVRSAHGTKVLPISNGEAASVASPRLVVTTFHAAPAADKV